MDESVKGVVESVEGVDESVEGVDETIEAGKNCNHIMILHNHI